MNPGRKLRGALWRCAIAAHLAVVTAGPAFAQTIPDHPWSHVTDLADALDGATERALEEKLARFERETTNQIFVLIAPGLGGRDEFSATFETASRWRIGQKGKDNGILIAVYMAERKLRIEVGYGLEGSVPDARANRIIRDVMVPRLRDGSPDLALHGAVDQLIAAIDASSVPAKEPAHIASDADQADRRGSDAADPASPLSTFEAGYIPPALIGPLQLIAIAYVLLSVVYAAAGGITARFDRQARRFRFRYDLIEFLSELIATQIITMIAAGVPTVVIYFILEEFHIQGYPVLLLAGAIVLVLYLRNFYVGVVAARRRVREITDNTGPWRKLESRFDAEAVERTRRYFRRCHDRWRPAFVFRNACEQLAHAAEHALKSPELFFDYTAAYARKRIDRLLGESEFWEECRATFVPAQVQATREDFEHKTRAVFGARDYDAGAASDLLNRLRALRKTPERIFEYPAAVCVRKIRAVLEDRELWEKWRKRREYNRGRVDRKYRALEQELARLAPTESPEEGPNQRAALNEFYRNVIQPLLSNPASFFRRQRSGSASAPGASISSYSPSASSSIGFSASSGGGSGSGAWGGGGSFGGGGSSGGW